MDIQNDQITIDRFALLSVIGKGSYAKVILVRKKDTDKLYAIKVLKKSYIEKKKQEVPLLKNGRNIS
jgi:serum/glucocorticoid-regulated kinase 2